MALSQEGDWAKSGAPGAALQCVRRDQPLFRGRTPVRNGNFQCLLKPQKSATLSPQDSVTDYVGWGNAGGAHSATGIDANPKLKQRAGAGLHQRLEAGVARYLLGSVLARRSRLVKRA
jgi:hypothetical protein